MFNPLWKILAGVLSRPAVVDWLIQRAIRTPYSHITKEVDGEESMYMERYWLFNPYPKEAARMGVKYRKWLPSIRLHKICRPDEDNHMHDHPWDARTIILRGSYIEERYEQVEIELGEHHFTHFIRRDPGDTAQVLFGQFHSIGFITKGGVWTMFFTWKYRGKWGFLVDGVKVPFKQYLGLEDKE